MGSGKIAIKIRLYKPNAVTPIADLDNEAFFEGSQDSGVNIITPFVLVADEEGLYWIDVLFVDDVITRIPLRVIFATIPAQQLQAHPGV